MSRAFPKPQIGDGKENQTPATPAKPAATTPQSARSKTPLGAQRVNAANGNALAAQGGTTAAEQAMTLPPPETDDDAPDDGDEFLVNSVSGTPAANTANAADEDSDELRRAAATFRAEGPTARKRITFASPSSV